MSNIYKTKKDAVEWEDLFTIWERHCFISFPEFQQAFTPRIVKKEDFGENYVDCDWLSAKAFSQSVKEYARNMNRKYPNEPYGSQNSIFILKMLISARSTEELAAIWIFSFTQDLINIEVTKNQSVIDANSAARRFLEERFIFPENLNKDYCSFAFYIDFEFLKRIDFSNYGDIVETTLINSNLMMQKRIPTVFSSYDNDEDMYEKLSVRLCS